MTAQIMIVSLWWRGNRLTEWAINTMNRYDYWMPPDAPPFDRITIEPGAPNSRVEFTPDGGVYRG